MSAEAYPQQALRPYLASDAPLLADIFRSSVEELAADDYSAAQQDAWAAFADDEDAFAQRLADLLTLVATIAGSPVGFACLEDNRQIDMLYVHPSVTGQGIASMLCDALEKLARARGSKRISVDASDAARGFFERRGYLAQQRNSVSVGGEWLANTTMTKQLDGERSAP
jgi:putative acetyltransferase